MKIRAGFVSNSSSSSFIIVSKTGKEITADMVKKALKVDVDRIIEEMAERVIECSEELDWKELLREYRVNNDEIEDSGFSKYRKYDKFRTGSVTDNGSDAIEAMVCEMDINYEDDDIIIEKDGGY